MAMRAVLTVWRLRSHAWRRVTVQE
jgi:hypothetical protein